MPKFTYSSAFYVTLFFFGVACISMLGSPISTVTATANSTTCSQTGSTGAACSVGSFGVTDVAESNATATWGFPGGRLEASANGNGSSASASASVSFSGNLIVTGATGSGILVVQFSGFYDPSGPDLADASGSPLSVDIGSAASSLAFPPGVPGTFTTSAPVAFETLIPFSVSFSDSATGIMFHDGTRGADSADSVLFFPTFLVTDASGLPIGNVNVQFTPEPASLALFACALPLLIVGAGQYRKNWHPARE